MTPAHSPRKSRKKDSNKLDTYIRFSIGTLIVYTIVVLLLSWFDHSVPSELTLGIFGFFGGEIVCSMLIKKYKLESETKVEIQEMKGEQDNERYNLYDTEMFS